MGKQPRWQTDRRLALFGSARAQDGAIENPVIEVDTATANRSFEASGANGRLPRARVQPDQDESREMLSGWSIALATLPCLLHTPCRPKQPGSLGTRKPALA